MRNTTNNDRFIATIDALDTINPATCDAFFRDLTNVARDTFIDATYNARFACVTIVAPLDMPDVETVLDELVCELCANRDIDRESLDVNYRVDFN